MRTEIWKPVPEFEGRYEVSDMGRIRSLRIRNINTDRPRTEPKILKPGRVKAKGYLFLRFGAGAEARRWLIHRLVLTVFAGPPPTEGLQAAHLNGDSTDNRLENLAWVTQSENEAHKAAHGTKAHGERMGSAAIDAATALEIREGCKTDSQAEVSRRFGVTESLVSRLMLGQTWGRTFAELPAPTAPREAAKLPHNYCKLHNKCDCMCICAEATPTDLPTGKETPQSAGNVPSGKAESTGAMCDHGYVVPKEHCTQEDDEHFDKYATYISDCAGTTPTSEEKGG